ncbi:MAG: HAD-IIIA family hydrolase [Candidatus Omnitrophica bacterium]|nr:HAD-IIIA family hydrolase [Candidatus Omnitrophota bacterium]
MNARIREKIKNIKLLIMDVDGVLTNGDIVLDENGKETKVFNVQDGFGIVLLQRAGLKTAILSARSAGAVTARAKDLKIDVIYQDAYPKSAAYQSLLSDFNLKDDQVCFIGDDLPDIEILKKAGFSVAVENAAEEVKEKADYITKCKGGCGAVREVIELILKTQKKWAALLKKYDV